MPDTSLPLLAPAAPEILLAISAMMLLMLGVFKKEGAHAAVTRIALVTLVLVAIMTIIPASTASVTTFGGMFIVDEFAVFMKVLIAIGAFSALLMAAPYLKYTRLERFEFPILILFATLGMFMMVSANDFLALYIGLELQSLSLYILAAFNRERQRSTEAGLKYFVLGALASGILLYGISLIYGFTGSTGFEAVAAVGGEAGGLGLIVGVVFVIAGLAFKVSAVPFHMWTPDVYEGAPTPVTAFFAAAPKIAAMGLFVRVMMTAFPDTTGQWQQVIILLSMGSMLVGAFVALVQTNIKRLMAYSSIGHVGFALMGLAAGSESGVRGVIFYMAVYLTMTVGTFICILRMKTKDGYTESIDDLAGVSKTRPAMASVLMLLMFSLAGIPLLTGFWGKWYVFVPAIEAGLYPLVLVAALATVVSAVYYIRIIKVMYMDEPKVTFEKGSGRLISTTMWAAAIFNSPIGFFLLAPALLAAATVAAASFFG